MRPGAELALQGALEALEVTQQCPAGGPRAGQQAPYDDPNCGRKDVSEEDKILVPAASSEVRYALYKIRNQYKDWVVKKSGVPSRRVYELKNGWLVTVTHSKAGVYGASVKRPTKKSD